MKLTDPRRKLLLKLRLTTIDADKVSNAKNKADLSWLSNAGLAECIAVDGDEDWRVWQITEAGEAALRS